MAARPPPTQLQRAFADLRKEHRLIVAEDCACCGTCAHAECSEMLEAHPDKVGYVFYHNQDLELAAECGTLWLGHAARDDMPDTVPALVTCDCLREHGLEVDWNGDVRTRIQVKLPKGPERDYFKRQLAEQYAQFEAEWYAEEEEDEEGGEGTCEERQQAAGGGEAGKAEGQA